MMKLKSIYLGLLAIFLCGCGGRPAEVAESGSYPQIFPDYQDVTIPINIAPLNFRVENSQKVEVEFMQGDKQLLKCKGDGSIDIPLKKWKSLLAQSSGKSVQVKVYASVDGVWQGYKPFDINIASDSISPYIAYRLIEPGYELGKKIGLYQRELSSFKESAFVDPNITAGSCYNCHAFKNYSPGDFMFHVRWGNSGTVIVEPGNARKVDTKTDAVISAGAYRMWHPSGDYIAFSNNMTRQAFHAAIDKKIEVYDLESGLMVYDVKNNKVLTDSRFTTSDVWKTLPAWSPDGKTLYYCEANPVELPFEYKDLKYQLYKVPFDPEKGEILSPIEKIEMGVDSLKSTVFPVASPDGKYLLYTSAESGTFPIWHKDSDLQMLDLATGEFVDMSIVNSDSADSYHAWSSNSRWIVFTSRRVNDLYTMLYFAYIDESGKMHKPFLLPQKSTDFYTYFLKSYNVPEFINGPITMSPYEINEIIKSEAIKAK